MKTSSSFLHIQYNLPCNNLKKWATLNQVALKKRFPMKQTYKILWVTLLGIQASKSCAMEDNSAPNAIGSTQRSSIERLRDTQRALEAKARQNGGTNLSCAQHVVRYCHLTGSTAAIFGAALHTEILPSTKTGIFGCFIGGAAAVHLSTRLLGLFFNYQNGNPKISRLKAYSCLAASFAAPALIAAGFYGLSQLQTIAHP